MVGWTRQRLLCCGTVHESTPPEESGAMGLHAHGSVCRPAWVVLQQRRRVFRGQALRVASLAVVIGSLTHW